MSAGEPTRIGVRTFAWGARTYVMGILNVTPDSFSGDGLLDAPDDTVARAVARARAMADDGADLLDIGGESTRPGHATVDEAEELRRVVPVVDAVRAALPEMPITIDTTKPAVAAAALDAGADGINDIWGVGEDAALTSLAAARGVPIVLMHNRASPRYADLMGEVIADLRRAVDRAVAAGIPARNVIVDPGIGFGKTAEQNIALLAGLGELRALGRPILLGTSRKSTIGKVLGGVPPAERLAGTLATTALGIAAGVDIVRVHDVRENLRAARIADAIVRGTWHDPDA
jgi:dihydropteroate synthase